MAECFRHCSPGYYWVNGGTCWQTCEDRLGPGNYGPKSDIGAVCVHNDWSWHGKKHYWADRRTRFHDECLCIHDDQYKSGCTCYKKCSTYGEADKVMEDCGYDACSANAEQCATTLINIVFELGFTLANIYSMGGAKAGRAVVSAAADMLQKAGQATMRAVRRAARMSITRAGMGRFVSQSVNLGMMQVRDMGLRAIRSASANVNVAKYAMKERAKRLSYQVGHYGADVMAKEAAEIAARRVTKVATEATQTVCTWAVDNVLGNMVKQLCQTISKAIFHSSDSEKYEDAKFVPNTLDPSGIWNAVDSCKDEEIVDKCNGSKTCMDDKKLYCASAITNAVGTFDPTGLLGLASAFMHPRCREATPPAPPLVNPSPHKYERDPEAVGSWGGSCTCADGTVFQVGDNYDGCGSLACFGPGAKPGTCHRHEDEKWAGKRATCVPNYWVDGPPQNKYEENVHRVGAWGGSCTCPDGTVYQVGDNYDSCGSLACDGGKQGKCNRHEDAKWAGKKVTCGALPKWK